MFKPKIQTPHKVAITVEFRLKEELDQVEKTRYYSSY